MTNYAAPRIHFLIMMFNSTSAEVDRCHRMARHRYSHGDMIMAKYYQRRAADLHLWMVAYRDEYNETVRNDRLKRNIDRLSRASSYGKFATAPAPPIPQREQNEIARILGFDKKGQS